MEVISDYSQKNKSVHNRVKDVLCASIVMTMLAHAYSFFNSSFSNDRISFFIEPDYTTAVMGRWFIQFYADLHAWSYLPWLEGVLMILFIAISLYAVVEVLQIQKRLSIWLIAGLYVTDISIVGGNLYEGDAFAFALALASISVWIWSAKDRNDGGVIQKSFQKSVILRVALGAAFICLSFATYGAYAPVAPTIVIIESIFSFFVRKNSKHVFTRVGEYVITFGLGMISYYIILRLFLKIQNLEMLSYMGEDRLIQGASAKEILGFLLLSYRNTLSNWTGWEYAGTGTVGMTKWIVVFLCVLGVVLFIIQLIRNKELFHKGINILTLILLCVLFPFSAGMIYILAFGNVHFLMVFPFVLFYVAIVKMLENEIILWKEEKKTLFGRTSVFVSAASIILIGFVVFRGILITNMAYSGMEKSYTSSKSIATRLMDRIESCEDATGEEMVVLVGDLSDNAYYRMPMGEGFYWKNKIGVIPIVTNSTAFSYYGSTRVFLRDVMGFYRNVAYYSPDMYNENDNQLIMEMPVFPADGSVKKMGESVVVKLAQ